MVFIMDIQFNNDLLMFLKLAKFLGVEFRSQIPTDKIVFNQTQLDFNIAKLTQTAAEYYKDLSSNIFALKDLGIESSHDFLRFQTKQLWYKDNVSYNAPSLFSPEYDFWFAKQLNKLFTDESNSHTWSKESFLTLVFIELKQMIVRPTSTTLLSEILLSQNSNSLVKDTLNNEAN